MAEFSRTKFRSLARRWHAYKPVRAFRFERPLVLFQSDDWGMCGIPDRAAYDALCAAGVPLGSNPYDFHSLETADDLNALYTVLARHPDASGRPPSFVLNCITANLDCARVLRDGWSDAALVPRHAGLPGGWARPGLDAAYAHGIAAGYIYPAYHGLTHFNRTAAADALRAGDVQGAQLRALYAHNVQQLYSYAPWLGFEFCVEGGAGSHWLDAAAQARRIAQGTILFCEQFGVAPLSACAAGYRANEDTRRAWAARGIRVAQNGPGLDLAPFVDRNGILMLYRNVELEPAVKPAADMVARALAAARRAAQRRMPVIVSMHAVNFHSTLRNNRAATLAALDEFLTGLRAMLPDLLFVHDGELRDLVTRGKLERNGATLPVRHATFWQRAPAAAERLRYG